MMKIFGRYAVTLCATLVVAFGLCSCSKDESVDTNLSGKVFQGSIVVSGRATAEPIYGQLVYRFLNGSDIELFTQTFKKVGSVTSYGVSGPDTINYIQNGQELDIKIEDESGNAYLFGYQGRLISAGFELWAGDDLQCFMTKRTPINMNGSEWQIAGTDVPVSLTKKFRIAFGDGVMTLTNGIETLEGVPYRTSGSFIISSFTFGGVYYPNFLMLHRFALNVYSFYTNINSTGITFTVYDPTVIPSNI